MAYQSLSSHGILAVLGMTAHHSLQPGLFSGLTKIPTPTLMEMLPTCLNVSWLCRYYQHGPSPSEHSNRLRKSRRTIQGFVEDLGSPRTRTQYQWYRHAPQEERAWTGAQTLSLVCGCRRSWQTDGIEGGCKFPSGPRVLCETSLALLEHRHVSVKLEEMHLKPNSCPQRDFYCVHKVNITAVD